ncbi:hypothetical protein V8C86DRAFT_1401777 [Haematococcus lacustris]
MLFAGLARLSFHPTSTAIDPISMTLSTLQQSTGFDDPGEVTGGQPIGRSTDFDQLRPPSTAIDHISMTPSILQKSTGFDDPGENVRRTALAPGLLPLTRLPVPE